MKTYKIYQLKASYNVDYAFMSYDYAKKHGFNLNDYVLIYTCDRDINHLDKLFEEFNVNKPKDFTGHSMSVSDLVEVDNEFWYCDSIRWTKVE